MKQIKRTIDSVQMEYQEINRPHTKERIGIYDSGLINTRYKKERLQFRHIPE